MMSNASNIKKIFVAHINEKGWQKLTLISMMHPSPEAMKDEPNEEFLLFVKVVAHITN